MELTTPLGRLVAGSLYKANDKDWQGNPLTTKTGANAGKSRSEFFFALAIPKGAEQHWSQTLWGQEIFNCACAGFPNGEPQRPDFAWKITDGDSQVPNKAGNAPASKVGPLAPDQLPVTMVEAKAAVVRTAPAGDYRFERRPPQKGVVVVERVALRDGKLVQVGNQRTDFVSMNFTVLLDPEIRDVLG